MTSIAHQTEEELGGPRSVLVRQRRDHAELETLLCALEASTGEEEDQEEDQEELLNRLNRLVFSHAFAEETVLWPVLRSTLADGDALTLRVEEEHQLVCELVSALERGEVEHQERRAQIARLAKVLREDARDEEDVLLARLQEAVSVEELRRLGGRWAMMRRISPTRPHPTVSRRPPGNALSGLPLTVIDRARDAIDSGVRRAPDRYGPAGRAISRALAGLAGLVEQVPAFRVGEQESTRR